MRRATSAPPDGLPLADVAKETNGAAAPAEPANEPALRASVLQMTEDHGEASSREPIDAA